MHITLPTNQSASDHLPLLHGNPAMSSTSRFSQQETLNCPSSPPKAATEMANPTPRSSTTPEITARRLRLPLPTRLQKGPSTTRVQGAIDDQKFLSSSPVTFQDWSKILDLTQQDDAANDALMVSSTLDIHELHAKVIAYVFQSSSIIITLQEQGNNACRINTL